MLYEQLKNLAYDYDIPKVKSEDYSYITENLKYPLYEWQKQAIENFLLNEATRQKKASEGITLEPNHLMFNMATGSGKTLVMAALILYYYKSGYRNFIFFVNQNAIVGKTQDNFINKSHSKYLFKQNIVIDGKHISIREVDMFSNITDDIQIKFCTTAKLHNDIYKQTENSLLLSDLQKRDIVLIGDEAHHLNATTRKKNKNVEDKPNEFEDISYIGEIKEGAGEEQLERSWETTVCYHILKKSNHFPEQNKNVLLEFTATIPDTEEITKKYEDKIIMKFDLRNFIKAGCTKHIKLVRSNRNKKQRILQALALNWYRYRISLDYNIPNFKPVILFRSKLIEESQKEYESFLKMCSKISADDFSFLIQPLEKKNKKIADDIPDVYNDDNKIFLRIAAYIKKNKLPLSRLSDYVKENFNERTCLITNSKSNKSKTKEKTDSKTDKLLNSLEDIHNPIRAIFTVQRLTEGWDVLNLYDIVRLYQGRDTDFKNSKAGKSTTSEVQLIGRGVRYYPFRYKDKEINRRKFDDDLTNPLRVMEEFYFHSDDDEKYISELSAELKRTGLITEKRTKKTFVIKDNVLNDLKKMYLFVNEKKENPNRRLKKLPDDFLKLEFQYKIKTLYSEIRNVDMDGDDETLKVASPDYMKTDTLHINEIPRNVVYKAIHKLNANPSSYFNFDNLRKKFDVKSMDDFLVFIGNIKISLSYPNGYEIKNSELLKITENFLSFCQLNLEQYDNPFIGTDFSLKPFNECFQTVTERMLEVDDSNQNTLENKSLEKEIKTAAWYAMDSFWGTSEERELVKFIKEHYCNLQNKYDKICLLRNEEVYKIYDFKEGRGFQPDFLLLMQGNKTLPKEQQSAYYQVFIEPKGKQLASNDDNVWKEEFLQDIQKKYGINKITLEKNDKYILIGLPFFNQTDNDMKKEFSDCFEKVVE